MFDRAMARRDRPRQIPFLRAELGVGVRRRGPARPFGMILFLAVLLCLDRAAASTPGLVSGEQAMPLPKQVGTWKLSEGPRRIEPKAIFDYMDGGGELYLGYRFRYLEVYDYRDPVDTQILLEVYHMESSDDAFGLLSLDSDGQEVKFGPEGSPAGGGIYGAGLLRLWSGDIFVRILAEKETPESRDAVMQLGKAVTAGRVQASEPAFLHALPAGFPGYRLNNREASYFRSYLVLNSIYFLGTQNILKLNLKTQAVIASYRSAGRDQPKSVRLLEIRYDTPGSALAAFRSFLQSYLPEHKCKASGKPASGPGAPPEAGTCQVEDGWVGYRVVGRTLVLGFQFPSEQIVRVCVDNATEQLENWEKNHE